MLDLPLWAVGLIIAGIAPFLVRLVADAIDALARGRTERAFSVAKGDDERS